MIVTILLIIYLVSDRFWNWTRTHRIITGFFLWIPLCFYTLGGLYVSYMNLVENSPLGSLLGLIPLGAWGLVYRRDRQMKRTHKEAQKILKTLT